MYKQEKFNFIFLSVNVWCQLHIKLHWSTLQPNKNMLITLMIKDLRLLCTRNVPIKMKKTSNYAD
ncbi:hypothetical protein T06_6065 [Trichinella sp. T6]|nr:hypothetical protein T06_6065 [Trichinella sp. T6]